MEYKVSEKIQKKFDTLTKDAKVQKALQFMENDQNEIINRQIELTLIPASDIVSATYGDGCCTGLTLRAGASADQWLILEQSSSFREENLNPDGPPRFRHTLTLVADPEEIRDRLGERQLARLATEGTVARIETASGVFLLAGRSEKFGAEQPLRLTEIRYESQTKFAARPVLVLTLAGEDTAPAPPIREQ